MRARPAVASRLHGRAVFVLGGPRSGADAVAAALTSLPGIAPAGVSELFSEGVPSVVGNFVVGQEVGISAVWTEAEFLTASRDLADDVLDPERTGEVVVDASPGEAEWVEIIALLYPDGRFLHVVRDPAEVATELPWWRPVDAVRAATRWYRAHRRLTEADRAPRFPDLPPVHLPRIVVGVADLRADPLRQLGRLVAGLPIEVADQDLERAAVVLADALPPARATLRGRVAAGLGRLLS
jgi:hypothetical protein